MSILTAYNAAESAAEKAATVARDTCEDIMSRALDDEPDDGEQLQQLRDTFEPAELMRLALRQAVRAANAESERDEAIRKMAKADAAAAAAQKELAGLQSTLADDRQGDILRALEAASVVSGAYLSHLDEKRATAYLWSRGWTPGRVAQTWFPPGEKQSRQFAAAIGEQLQADVGPVLAEAEERLHAAAEAVKARQPSAATPSPSPASTPAQDSPAPPKSFRVGGLASVGAV